MKTNFWDKTSGIYDIFTSLNRSGYRRIIRLAADELGPGDRVLELAAGTGVLTLGLASHCKTLVATDFSRDMLRKIKSKNPPANVLLRFADAQNLKYSSESFDTVVIGNALHIVPDPRAVLGEIYRVLKPGGKLIAPTYMRKNSGIEKFFAAAGERIGFKTYTNLTPDNYKEFVRRGGFYVTNFREVDSFPKSVFLCAVKPRVY